jgi:putative membrane protein
VKRLSPILWIKAVYLLVLALLFAVPLLAGGMGRFLHPRMIPWSVAGGVLLILLAAGTIAAGAGGHVRRFRLTPALPILMLPLAFSGVFIASEGVPGRPGSLEPSVMGVSESIFTGLIPPDGIIEMTEEGYWLQYLDLTENYPLYKGREIRLTGFVYRDEGMDPRQLFVMRQVIFCCAADLSMVGFVLEADNLSQYPDGTWLTVTGVYGDVTWASSLVDDPVTTPGLLPTGITVIDTPEPEPWIIP